MISLKRLLICTTLVIAAPLLLSGCFAPDVFREQQRYFDEHIQGNPAIKKALLETADFQLFYASAGKLELPAVVFLHGTPGSWRAGARYLTEENLLQHARVVSIDRPGWGESLPTNKGDAHGNQTPTSVFRFAEQASLIAKLLARINEENAGRGIVLIGHSLGASLAPRVALDAINLTTGQSLVSGMLLLSGSLDPQLGKPRWFNRLASTRLVNLLIGDGMQKANHEIMTLSEELSSISHRWGELSMPITLIQGGKDDLVSPLNADFAEQMLARPQLKVIRLPDSGHVLHLEQRALVVQAAIDLTKRLATETEQRLRYK